MGSTSDVSWNKPFGNSAASNLVGGAGGASSIMNGVSMTNPLGQTSYLAQATGHGNGPLTSTGKNKETGEQEMQLTPTADYGGIGTIPTMVQRSPTANPAVNSVAGSPSPRSAMALEERLRASKRQAVNPNVEYGFNLEKNPIANSIVRPMGGK